MRRVCESVVPAGCAALMCALAAGCADELPGAGLPYEKGEPVVFSVKGDGKETRTVYEDDWDVHDGHTTQTLFWGNYPAVGARTDRVRVFSQPCEPQSAVYAVDTVEEGRSSSVRGFRLEGGEPLSWDANRNPQEFCAVYPSEAASPSMTGSTTVKAHISPGQMPVQFEYRHADGTRDYDFSVLKNYDNEKGRGHSYTFYGYPDMRNALMKAYAKAGGSDPTPGAAYGQPVPLTFSVVPDVLDIAVSGPISPNTLRADGSSLGAVRIRKIVVESRDGSTPIAGDFDYDARTGKARVTRGFSRIEIKTTQTCDPGSSYSPLLYAKFTDDGSRVPEYEDFSHVRVRAFLIPGQIRNFSELRIRVQTDCGEYVKDLEPGSLGATGRVHLLRLPYLKERGRETETGNWLGDVPDDVYLTQLTLPGSWRSTDIRYQKSGTSLTRQYASGIRAFHLRVHAAENSTPVYGTPVAVPGSEVRKRYSYTLAENRWYDEKANKVFFTQEVGFVEIDGREYERTVTTGIEPVDSASNRPLVEILRELGQTITPTEMCMVEAETDGWKTSPVIYQSLQRYTGGKSRRYTIIRHGEKQGRNTVYTDGIVISKDSAECYAELDRLPFDTESQAGFREIEPKHVFRKFDVKGEANREALLATIGGYARESGNRLCPGPIDATTTLGDVRGRIVLRLSLPSGGSSRDDWGDGLPALFTESRSTPSDTPEEHAVSWGSPGGEAIKELILRCERVKINLNPLTGDRLSGIDRLTALSGEAHARGDSSTFVSLLCGGYGARETEPAVSCGYLLMHTLDSGSRPGAPLGTVYFNDVLNPFADAYTSGPSMTRSLIDNNLTFTLLHR